MSTKIHTYTKEELESVVKNMFSIADILRYFKIPCYGNNYKTLKSNILKWEIDISHFTGQLWAKGKMFPPKRPINDYLSGKQKISSHMLKLRLIKEGIFQHICQSCGLSAWKDTIIPLELHHIDGDRFNNNLANLQILCPNCHAQTDNYCSKKIKGAKKTCMDCDVEIYRTSTRCFSCNQLFKSTSKKSRIKNCECGKIIKISSPKCRSCTNINNRKVSRPNKEQLIEDIKILPMTKIGIKYGVSDNAIRKWCKEYSIDYKSLLCK